MGLDETPAISPDSRFADLLDSMGMVEFLCLVADDCGVTPGNIEECVDHRFETVAELAEPFGISQPAVSKHLKVLEHAGLISRSVDRQRRPRRLEARPLAEAAQWIERYREFWQMNFQRLDTLLDAMKTNQAHARRSQRRRRKP